MGDGAISYEKQGQVGIVGFDRPDKRNAFTVHMFRRVAEVFTEADEDMGVHAIVLHGHGQDTTTGLDLMNVGPSFRAGQVPIPDELVDPWHVVGRLRRTPMVMAAHGRCFTLGTELALCSDICIAEEGTRFGLKEVRAGIMPAGGGTFRFVQAAGYANAMRYVLTGEEFDANEAYRLGVVQEVVPQGTHLDRAIAMAELIAAQAPLAVRAALANSQASLLEGFRTAIDAIVPTQVPLINSDDAMEAAMAMLERRTPQFKGK
ncbi:MAG: crotonase/enoyl-CoA hydratase family protein [Myxococcota bacterium]